MRDVSLIDYRRLKKNDKRNKCDKKSAEEWCQRLENTIAPAS